MCQQSLAQLPKISHIYRNSRVFIEIFKKKVSATAIAIDIGSKPIEVGQFFPSFGALHTTISDWSITDKFLFRVPKKDSSSVVYTCRSGGEGCPWHVSTSFNKDEAIKIKNVNNEHTCIAAPDSIRKTANIQEWLRRVVLSHLWITKMTTPKQIIETCAIHYNEIVRYEAARFCKQHLVQDRLTH